MRLEERHHRYLDGECSPQERAAVEAEISASNPLKEAIDAARKVDDRVRGACREEISSGHRQAIWSRFNENLAREATSERPPASPFAAPRSETQPPVGAPTRRWDWRFLALPVAVAAAFLLALNLGLFSSNGDDAPSSDVWYRQSEVIDAALISEHEFRQKVPFEAAEADYIKSLQSAEATERVFKCFFGKKTMTRANKVKSCEELLSQCSENPIAIPPFPDTATIDAFRVYDVTLPNGAVLQVPQFLISTETGERMSVHLICGSQMELVEEALRSKNPTFKISDDRPTNLCDNGASGCSVSILPKGPHLMMVVSKLPAAKQQKLLERF